jgi:hypothetical protein
MMRALLLLLAVTPLTAFAAGLTVTVAEITTYEDGAPLGAAPTYVLYDGVTGNELDRGTNLVFQRPTAAPGKRCYASTSVVDGIESTRSPVTCIVLEAPKKKPATQAAPIVTRTP